MLADLHHYFFVLLYKGYYCLTVIFWDVFCLVLQLLLCHLRTLLLLLLWAALVLRHSFELGYGPGFLIELGQAILTNRNLTKLHNARILLLFLDNPIEHAIMIIHLHIKRKDIIDLDLTGSLTLTIEVVLQHREVKDRRAVSRLYQD